MIALLVGAGRRVSFAERMVARGYQLWAYEDSYQVPIADHASVYRGRPWAAGSEDLYSLINSLQPDLVLGFQDEAVVLLSEIPYAGIVAPCPNAAVTCYDKRLFQDAIRRSHPELYPEDLGTYPKIIKPVTGFGSRGVHVIRTPGEEAAIRDGRPQIVQRQIIGTEYTVDAYFSLGGEYVDSVPRVRERVAGGEVISSRSIKDEELSALTKSVGESLGLEGPVCLQFIREDGGRPWLIEANARFGGGSILSMVSGFDMIGLLEADYLGKPNTYIPGSWTPTAMHRYFQEFFYDPNGSS